MEIDLLFTSLCSMKCFFFSFPLIVFIIASNFDGKGWGKGVFIKIKLMTWLNWCKFYVYQTFICYIFRECWLMDRSMWKWWLLYKITPQWPSVRKNALVMFERLLMVRCSDVGIFLGTLQIAMINRWVRGWRFGGKGSFLHPEVLPLFLGGKV